MKRGKETRDHWRGKRIMAAFWTQRAYRIAYERGSDLIAWRIQNGRLQAVFNEYERSLRNVTANQSRNAATAGPDDKGLIAALSSRLARQIRRKLQREFPRKIWTRIAVVTLDQLIRATNSGAS